MRPGGLSALRTPEQMDGVLGLSPAQQQKVKDSQEIQRKGQSPPSRRDVQRRSGGP